MIFLFLLTGTYPGWGNQTYGYGYGQGYTGYDS